MILVSKALGTNYFKGIEREQIASWLSLDRMMNSGAVREIIIFTIMVFYR